MASDVVFTGYYTSRPTSKRLERFANNLLQVNKQINALSRMSYAYNNSLSQAMGVMQHHDAITGTERADVEKDYHRSLVKGIHEAVTQTSSAFSSILGSRDDLNLKSCLLANVSICSESEKDEFTVLLYNPLARTASHYIQIPVSDGTWEITGPSGDKIENHLRQPIRNFDYIEKATGEKVLEKILVFKAENLPAVGYKVYTIKKTSPESKAAKEMVGSVDQMGFEDRYVNFDVDTGLLKSITLNNVTMNVSQEMLYYRSEAGSSNAYIFRPDLKARDAIKFGDVSNTVLINDGNLVREVKQTWKDWASQVVRIYRDEDFIEFNWMVGPIDVSDDVGKEVITRYKTELTTDSFYTDSNGREMMYRKKNYRPTYEYTDEEPQAGNYYPVTTKILLKDEENEFAVLTDRSEGGSSLNSGELELMLSRTLLHVENGVTGENLNESEYNQLLVATGNHFVTLGSSSEGNGGRTMAAVERDIAQRKLLQPWLFFVSEDIPIRELSFLNTELPANVHLLTLDNWNESEDTILIRLEHILEKDEDPNLSKDVTVDLSDLFKTIQIKSMKEYTLAANTPLEESSRLIWPQIHDADSETSPLNVKHRLTRSESDLTITLAAMQIRTFVATIEKKS